MKTRLMSLAFVVAATTAVHAQEKTIAVMTKNQTNPFFQLVRLGADDAARTFGVKVIHYVPQKADSIPEQINQLEDIVTKRPAAIVFDPVDFKALAPAIQKVNDAGIPIVDITDRAEKGKFVTFIGAADFEVGKQIAIFLSQKLGGKGNIVVLEGVRGAASPQERLQGAMAGLKENPGIRVVASQTANNQRLNALQVMENLLQTHPQIDGVLAINDAMATGAVEAIEATKRKIIVVGVNGSREAVDLIKADKLAGTGDVGAFLQGCLGVAAAMRQLGGQPVPKEILIPPTVVQASNVKDFDVPLEKMKCPSWESVVK